MRIADLVNFIVARHDIWKAKIAGKPAPWTTDPILQSYRFCNVFRELDTQTTWIRDNWRRPLSDHPYLFFAMLVARVVNWNETLEQLRLPIPWDRNHFHDVLLKRKVLGQKVWTGAYMITTHKQAMSKERYYADNVLQPVWDNRNHLMPRKDDTLDAFHRRLAAQDGIGSFLAAQVVADTKWSAGHLKNAKDWWTWAAPGHGSVRGLNRVMDRPYKTKTPEKQWRAEFAMLHMIVNAELHHYMLELDAQDLQNCLCEFDKYERVRLGQGKPRSRYNGLGDK